MIQPKHVARTGERRGACRVLVGKPAGKNPLGRPRFRWEYNVKVNLQGVVWGAWTGLIRFRTGTVVILWFHRKWGIS